MSWKDWKFNQIFFLGQKYHYFYSMSMGHPESYITEKLCLMISLARLLLFLVYDNHFWPKNTVRVSFFIKFKKITMNLHQYCNKQNPPAVKVEMKNMHRFNSYGQNKIDYEIMAISFVFRPYFEPKMTTLKEALSKGPQRSSLCFWNH